MVKMHVPEFLKVVSIKIYRRWELFAKKVVLSMRGYEEVSNNLMEV
ncbi:hypothetical protein [Petrotoga sp. DB-2]